MGLSSSSAALEIAGQNITATPSVVLSACTWDHRYSNGLDSVDHAT
jgi:hypothetical protein